MKCPYFNTFFCINKRTGCDQKIYGCKGEIPEDMKVEIEKAFNNWKPIFRASEVYY